MIDEARAIVSRAKRLVSFSGAGLSAESGVPTFRDAKSGFWANYDPMRLASPEGFQADPELVIQWYNDRRRQMHFVHPNAAHLALARHADITHVTQNIDDLLARAGASSIVQLHGTITRDRCHGGCAYEEIVDLQDPPGLRRCPRCNAYLRPSVVWFGEVLPEDAWQRAEQACTRCDVMLVIGTSGVVYPAAGLVSLAKQSGATIIIVNTERSEASALGDIDLLGQAGDLVPKLLSGRSRGAPK